jgi:ribosomal protein S18 acetylase RimI-like enzyme
MKKYFGILLNLLFGEWDFNYIYKKEIVFNTLFKNKLQSLNFHGIELAEEKINYVLIKDGITVCSCILIWGHEYKYNFRSFIKLRAQDAKVVRVETHSDYRGQGLAGLLLDNVAQEASKLGFTRLLAIIWHSNISSIKAFKKNGFSFYGIKLKLRLFKLIPIDITINLPK